MTDYTRVLTDYATFTRTTAIYPGAGDGLDSGDGGAHSYLCLGLISEIGEVAGKVKKVLRDSGCVFTDEHLAAIAPEVADCLWYLVRLADEAGILAEVAEHVDASPGFATPGGEGETWWRLLVGVRVLTAQAYTISATNVPGRLTTAIGVSLLEISALAETLGSDLPRLIAANVEKLASRSVRGVLSGSGDYR